MKTRSNPARFLTAATLAVAGISAFVVLPAHAQTRAEVAAEARAAVASGQIRQGEFGGAETVAPRTASTLTRSAVRSETVAASKAGQLALRGEFGAYDVYSNASDSTLTRAEVKSETVAASKAGELSGRGEELNVEANASQHALAIERVAEHRSVLGNLFAKHRAANAVSGT
jgi:ATP/maltotriose-dependent transcriptional regulator MalT